VSWGCTSTHRAPSLGPLKHLQASEILANLNNLYNDHRILATLHIVRSNKGKRCDILFDNKKDLIKSKMRHLLQDSGLTAEETAGFIVAFVGKLHFTTHIVLYAYPSPPKAASN
jgi:hypothetical protein